jgi:hypothetical protein
MMMLRVENLVEVIIDLMTLVMDGTLDAHRTRTAGMTSPARNDYNAIIGYLAVLPAHRGNGYIDEILAEGTRILSAQDVPSNARST